MLRFPTIFLPCLVCEMNRVCSTMNRCSIFCTTCGLRSYFLHFIQTLTLKSKWLFSLGTFHDAHHCNIWTPSPKIINSPSQHPWAVQVLCISYKQAIKEAWNEAQVSLLSRVLNLRHPTQCQIDTFYQFLFRHKTFNSGHLFPNFSAC